MRNWKLLHKWGISAEDYDTMLDAQDGVCAICQQPSPTQFRLAVDHCHVTGRIRGLLCTLCNTGIGGLRDDPALLAAAITYLETQ